MQDPKGYFDREWLEYLRHLPEDVGHPIEVLVLRGHILIERQLNRLIELQLPNPTALDLEQMRFASKVSLAEALCGHQVHEWVWNALRSVNNLRNSLAHKLDDAQLPNHAKKFIAQIQLDDPLTFQLAGTELESQLAHSLAWLHERLLNECINRNQAQQIAAGDA
jgi:hypothetical protein